MSKIIKKQKSEDGSLETFGAVLDKLLTRPLTEEQKSRPILSAKRHIEETIDDAKLEAKAKRELSYKRKQRKEEQHQVLLVEKEDIAYEKALRKTATKGVVQLFNAIKDAQKQQLKPSLKPRKKTEEPPIIPTTDVMGKKLLLNLPNAGPKKPSLLAALPAYAGLVNVDVSKGKPITVFPKSPEDESQEQKSKGQSGQWKVLQDEFMTAGNMKDWDQSTTSESEI